MMERIIGKYRSLTKRLILHSLGGIDRLGRGAERSVLLTFDDGPHPSITDDVLDRLKRFSARAVFYVVGNRVPRAPHVLSRICREGHLIGNHTFEHWSGRPPGRQRYLADLLRCQDTVRDLTGTTPTLFRPPLGRITLAGASAARRAGLRTMMWSVDSEDWRLRDQESAVKVAEGLQSRIGVGDIVLFHDDNPCVLVILDRLLPHLAARNFRLDTGAASFTRAAR